MPEQDRLSRLRDRLHNFWIDQGVIRMFWANAATVAPGVFRSNQPNHRRLARMKAQGLVSVLYLRGSDGGAPFRAERHACAALELRFHSFNMSAHRLPTSDRVLALIALFRRIEKPFLLHCRAGADRTGLASAIYLLAIEGRPAEEAAAMLSRRFGHWSWSSTGVLDRMVATFRADHAVTGIGFEEWIATRYDPAAITAEFARQTLWDRISETMR